MAIPRICGFCGKVVTGRCACQRQRDKQRKAAFDKKRPIADHRGYTSKWKQARAAFLKQNPRCSWPGCRAPATVVDHDRPHKGDQRLFWDPRNWKPLCQHHHNSGKQSLERRTAA